MIVFTRYRSRSRIYVMNADGTAATRVNRVPERERGELGAAIADSA
jgi:hypothetical protein